MINYKGKPLFGQDSSVSNTSEFFAIAGTILFWLLFFIFSFVIKPQPKKKYKEVQIVLSSTPVVQKTEEASAPSEAASASASEQSQNFVEATAVETPAEEIPAVETSVVETPPAPAVKENSKPAPKQIETPKQKPKTQPSKPTPVSTPIYKSNEELLAEQLNRKKEIDPNYDPFANENDNTNNSNESDLPRVVGKNSTISGKAGDSAANVDTGKLQSEHKTDKRNDNITQGGKYKTIRESEGIGFSESDSGKSLEKSAGKDKNSVIWTNGTGARTYYNLDTELSLKARSSMQVSKPTPFTITFSVDSDGNVMGTTIEIKNEFILSDIIKKEMKEKISSWKFGKGSGISKAQFDWILSPGN